MLRLQLFNDSECLFCRIIIFCIIAFEAILQVSDFIPDLGGKQDVLTWIVISLMVICFSLLRVNKVVERLFWIDVRLCDQ